MKNVYKKVDNVMEIVVEQRLLLTHAFNYRLVGLCFGVPPATCLLHMLLSNPIRLFKYIRASPSD